MSASDPGLVRALLHGVRHGQVYDLAQPVSQQSPHLPVQQPFQIATSHVRLAEIMGSELDTEVFDLLDDARNVRSRNDG